MNNQNNFLDRLKVKPLDTNKYENGITVFLPTPSESLQNISGIMPVQSNEEKRTTKVLSELVDTGAKAIEYAEEIRKKRQLQQNQPKIQTEPSVRPKTKTQKKIVFEEREGEREREGESEYESEGEVLAKPKTKSSKKIIENTAMLQTNAVYKLIDKDLMIGTKKLGERIPLPPENFIKIPNYVMNNRLAFIRFANDTLFRAYKDIMDSETGQSQITCDNLASGSANAGLMLHQQLVRDYLNLVTPYRGLLLYHGLGSGKTCSSIAIAEGMKDSKKIIVMLPASLQRNYIEEIKKCGDPIFKRNQYWEWIEINDQEEDEKIKHNLGLVLSLTPEEIERNGGVWITDISKPSNISSLNPNQLKSLNTQLDNMIRKKYQFINYNGLRKEKFKALTNDYTVNIFDNSVIIIDEAHNLISRIVNKISKLKTTDTSKSKKKFVRETVNRGIESEDELSLQIYHMLMMAVNCKIVLLTGTPIINYPNEIGILFNILRGYIKTWSFNLRPAEGTNKIINENILKNIVFSRDKILDYMKYTPTSQKLVITRNPFGFESVIKESRENEGATVYQGVSNTPTKKKDDQGRTFFKERRLITDDEFQNKIIKLLRDNQINATFEGIKYNLALPDKLDEFLSTFIEINKSGRMKNEMKFKKRIMGLTSYFRSAQEELLPRYDKKINKHIVEINMSNFQFNLYALYRRGERILEKDANQSNAMNANKPGEIFKQQSSTYRIMSRLACNITLPDRPNLMDTTKYSRGKTKKNAEEEEEKKEEKEEEKGEVIQVEQPTKKKRPKVVKFAEPTATSVQPSTSIMPISQPRSRLSKSQLILKTEEMLGTLDLPEDKKNIVLNSIDDFENTDFGKKYKFEKLDDANQQRMLKQFKKYSSKIQTTSNFQSFNDFFQEQLSKNKKGGGLSKLLMIGGLNGDGDEDGEEDQEQIRNEDDVVVEDLEGNIEDEIENTTSGNYKQDVLQFIENVKQNSQMLLSIEPQDGGRIPLLEFSPKYVEMIKNIVSDSHLGLHLLYSQFRHMEGLEIFSLALDVNGFKQFKLSKNSSGILEVSRDFLESEDNTLFYAMYTGEESSDERELIRKIYNGDWNEIPQNIREQLQRKSENNNMGEIIKLLMITSAGAEGINLRNTRYVHIMEPYWHPVRVEQVIGRARRICSHAKLPEDMHTVDVFVYISVFTKEQLESDNAIEINRNDKSSIEPFKPESSDQKLLQTSNIKEAVSENILKSVKETSIDCATYSSINENKEGLKCLSFNSAKIDEFSYVPDYEEQQQDSDIPLGQIRKTTTFKKLTLRDGTTYMLNPTTNEFYNETDVEQANPLPIGRMTAIYTTNEDGEKIPSGKTTLQYYKKSSVIDENV